MQGLYALDPRRAQLRLRGTLVSTSASDADRALVQVCAGKLRVDAADTSGAPDVDAAHDGDAPPHNVTAAAHDARTDVQSSALGASLMHTPLTRRSVAEALRWARRTRHRNAKRARSDRTIVALLIDANGRIAWAARNAAGANKTMHAEMVLLQSYAMAHGAISPGCNVYVSLSPCRMCAAALAEALPAQSRVAFLRKDSGRYATHTALQQTKRLIGPAPMHSGLDDVFGQPEPRRSL